jgi:hypothetical protein
VDILGVGAIMTTAAFLVCLTRVYPKVSGLSRNEIKTNSNKHSLRNNIKGYGGKNHYTDSRNSDTTSRSGRELYHLQFSLQIASPETFGYTLVFSRIRERPVCLSACFICETDERILIKLYRENFILDCIGTA